MLLAKTLSIFQMLLLLLLTHRHCSSIYLHITVFACGSDADCGRGTCHFTGDASSCECEIGFMGQNCEIGKNI